MIENTAAIRNEIMARIEADGVRLSEFAEAQKIQIIKNYAAVVLADK